MEKLDPNDSQDLTLQAAGLLADLTTDQLLALQQFGNWYQAHNDVIIQDGAPQKNLYIIGKGKVIVFKYDEAQKKKIKLSTLKETDCFGEMAFLSKEPSTANITATGEVLLFVISHESLKEFVFNSPAGGQLCYNLAMTLSKRVKEGNSLLIGVTSSLSAYFGLSARNQSKMLEAPLSEEFADIEIDEHIHDLFIRDTLEKAAEDAISEAERNQVNELIKNNEVDFIQWLESGEETNRFAVRLRFVKHEDVEKKAPTAKPDFRESKPKTGIKFKDPRATQKLTQTSTSLSKAKTRVVKVPQAQVSLEPRTAVITKPLSLFSKFSYGLGWTGFIIVILAFLIPAYVPFSMRESWVSHPSLGSPLVNWFLFRTNAFSESAVISPTKYFEVDITLTSAGMIAVYVHSENPQWLGTKMFGTIRNKDLEKVGSSNFEVDLSPSAEGGMHNSVPAGRYKIKVSCVNCGGKPSDNLTITVKAIR